MNTQLPNSVSSLLSFLKNDCGLSIEGHHIFPAFGDTVIVLRGQHLRVRVVRDRGDWFAEVGSEQKQDDWYDMGLLKELIIGRVKQDVLSFDELATFLRANWQTIVDLLTSSRSCETYAALERIRQERAKRRFPKWYK